MDTVIETSAPKGQVRFFKTIMAPKHELPVTQDVLSFYKLNDAKLALTDVRLSIVSFERDDGKRTYYVVDKRYWIICVYRKASPKRHHEHFLADVPIKLVLDLEIKDLDKMSVDERKIKIELFHRFKNFIIYAFSRLIEKNFGEPVKTEDFLVMTASDEDVKMSEHITLENGIYFKNIITVKHLVFAVLQLLFKQSDVAFRQAAHDMVWDTGIYKVGGSLKLPYSSNLKEETNPKRTLKPVGNPTFDPSIVERSMFQYGTPRVICELDAPIDHYEKVALEAESIMFPDSKKKTTAGTFAAKDIDLDDDEIKRLEQMLDDIRLGQSTNLETGFIYKHIGNPELAKEYKLLDARIKIDRTLIIRTHAGYCPIAKRYHHAGVPTFYIKEHGLTSNCFSSQCKGERNFSTVLKVDDVDFVTGLINKYI